MMTKDVQNTIGGVLSCVFLALVILGIEQGRTLETTAVLHHSPAKVSDTTQPEPTARSVQLPSQAYTKRKKVIPSTSFQTPPIADNPYIALFTADQEPRNRARATTEYLSRVVYLGKSEPSSKVSKREGQATNPYLALEIAHTTEEQRVKNTLQYLQTVSALP